MWGGQTTSDRYDSFTVSSSITNLSKVLGSTSHGLSFFSLFFIWLCQVLAAACEIFIAAHRIFSCSMWDLVPQHGPLNWERGVPAIRPQGNSPKFPYTALPMCQHYSKHLMYVTHLMTTINNSAR